MGQLVSLPYRRYETTLPSLQVSCHYPTWFIRDLKYFSSVQGFELFKVAVSCEITKYVMLLYLPESIKACC
jgi:hypothetical protein